MTNQDFRLFNRSEYLSQLIVDIKKTVKGDRVAITTMTLDIRQPLVNEIMRELTYAASRGVAIYIAVDARILLTHEKTKGPGPLWFVNRIPKYLMEPFRSTVQSLDSLAKSGGNFAIINQPKRAFKLPHAGRSHLKIAIINNTVYLGGSNLERPDDMDVMAQWHDAPTADFLYDFIQSLVRTGSSRASCSDNDIRKVIDNRSEILIDAGKPDQSIIFSEALKLIDAAKESLFLTCQYVPHGVLANHIMGAIERDVSVTLLFNHPSKHSTYEALLQHAIRLNEKRRLPEKYFKDELSSQKPFLHTKVIATEQAVLIGSHNYISTGVHLGTAEIALIRRDPELAQQTVLFVKEELGLQ